MFRMTFSFRDAHNFLQRIDTVLHSLFAADSSRVPEKQITLRQPSAAVASIASFIFGGIGRGTLDRIARQKWRRVHHGTFQTILFQSWKVFGPSRSIPTRPSSSLWAAKSSSEYFPKHQRQNDCLSLAFSGVDGFVAAESSAAAIAPGACWATTTQQLQELPQKREVSAIHRWIS